MAHPWYVAVDDRAVARAREQADAGLWTERLEAALLARVRLGPVIAGLLPVGQLHHRVVRAVRDDRPDGLLRALQLACRAELLARRAGRPVRRDPAERRAAQTAE